MSKIEVNQISSQCGSTLTIGQSGDTVTLAAGATQSGFGRTGTVDWDTTAKTTNFTAVSGNGYFVNTTSGVVTMTLPASPSAGDIVAVADYANTFATNKLTIGRNGSLINGGAYNYETTTDGISLTFVYVDGTRGWKNVNDGTTNASGLAPFILATGGTIVTCGNYKTHIFTGPGTFCVSSIAPAPSGNPNSMEYIVVAGGGGAGSFTSAGGGAGGFRLSSGACIPAPTMSPLVGSALTATVSSFPITVGGGGAGGLYPNPPGIEKGSPGSNSIFSTITSAGGGGGGAYSGPVAPGIPGGSGGGGGGEGGGSAGTGNTPPVSPPQGNDGGAGGNVSPRAGGGGGGAGGTGTPGVPSQNAGPGGAGSFLADAFIGTTAPSYGTPGPVASTRYFAGGGGGGTESTPALGLGSNGAGGVGGGGQGGQGPTTGGPGTPGTTNTGGGGGGASRYDCGAYPFGPGGSGGSGIVMIRYKYQ